VIYDTLVCSIFLHTSCVKNNNTLVELKVTQNVLSLTSLQFIVPSIRTPHKKNKKKNVRNGSIKHNHTSKLTIPAQTQAISMISSF